MVQTFKGDDEEGRARALERYEVLDTQEEDAFETIMNLVQQILDVPICAVSLVDRERQWFKAQRGLSVSETPREISFCTHTVERPAPFLVPDALRDPLFSDSPLVTGEPGIRSYLGIPLMTPEGYAVGSLCVVDTKPRSFTERQVKILSDFAKVIVNELESRTVGDLDSLTGAFTRATWEASALAELRRTARYGNPLSFAIFDLDRLSAVNECHGYSVGDEVIRRFANLCHNQIRDTDILGRFGGEEFILLLPETSCENALSIVERLRTTFSETPIPISTGVDLLVTVSAGLTSSFGRELSVGELLRRADQALLDAKRSGRNCTIVDDLVPLEPALGLRAQAGQPL